MKQILNEQLTSSLFEEVRENKPSGILKRIKGIVADFKPNRNGRIYPRELWEKVINSEYVKEMMASKCLFGENKILEGNHGKINLEKYSSELQDLINLLLKKVPDKRPDIEVVYNKIKELKNKKFKKNNSNSSDTTSSRISKRDK